VVGERQTANLERQAWEVSNMSSSSVKDLLFDHLAWAELSLADVEAISGPLSAVVGPKFEYVRSCRYTTGFVISTFRHRESGVEFNLLPGGRFQMGLSEQEYRDAIRLPNCRDDILRGLMPVRDVTVEPFLMSRFPLLEQFVRQHVQLARGLFRPEFSDDPGDPVPVYMTRDEVEAVTTKFGFLLPAEAQWEYAVRGATTTLFYFGSAIPDRETLANKILLTKFSADLIDDVAVANPFGLIGMLTGSWCRERYAPVGQAHRVTNLQDNGPYVVRGGGAIFWPWQNQSEWMMCMSAMRMSSDDFEDGTCSVQVVMPLGG
jgi:formylglycine-generating enzyme required for sulfatase activity